jgi:hypothetical protein
VLVVAACQPAEVPVVEPTAAVQEPAPLEPIAGDDAPTSEPSDAEGFVVTLASRCGDTWKGVIVRGNPAPPKQGPGGFDVSNARTHELEMRPGDSLLLTSPHGGIMALQFDSLAAGDDARVEVTPECSGVKRTIVRKP